MVKSKKLSRGSLAVFLLALVLACSLFVGVTGAFFTDNDSASISNGSNSFGEIHITATESSAGAWAATEATTGYVMPGSSYGATITVSNLSTEDVKITALTVTGTVTINGHAYTVEQINAATGLTCTVTTQSGLAANAVLAKDASKTVAIAFEIDTSVGNTVTINEVEETLNSKDSSALTPIVVALSVSVEAIQTTNNA